MRKLPLFLLLLIVFVSPAFAAKDAVKEKVSVSQLSQKLNAAHGQSDADMAQQLAGLELTERLSAERLAQLTIGLPGDKSRQAFDILADLSAFLNSPEDEIPVDSPPDPVALRLMMTQIVNYVNTTVRQLPNLIATRDTVSFEDRPQEDTQGETGLTTLIYLPLRIVGKSRVNVTYRDRREIVEEGAAKAMKHGLHSGGLATTGEFGPILSSVVADAIQGKITWSHWEQSVKSKLAVFHFEVPGDKSHYSIEFCCISNGFNQDGSPIQQVFNERSAYRGEIAFDPQNGAIFRVTMQAEVPSGELVTEAGLSIDYGQVSIVGKDYICPIRSVSILRAHTAQQTGMISRSHYKGAAKTFLNDVSYGEFRRFGSETRILTGDTSDPK